MKFCVFAATVFILYQITDSARILSVIPTAAKSHYSSCRMVILELARRGHDVVSISPYEEKEAPDNFQWIEIELKLIPKSNATMGQSNFFSNIKQLWDYINHYVTNITNLPKLREFIESDNSKFDLVIVEEFLQPLFLMFSHKYNAPLVLISSFGHAHYINKYIGNPLELSYVPHQFSEIPYEMDIWDRFKNIIYTMYDHFGRQWYVFGHQNRLAQDLFKGLGDLPKLEDLERNVTLILTNSHFTMTQVRPLLPNMIEIGGVHIAKPQALDKDIKKMMDEADNGVVLFSMGSVVNLKNVPKEKLEAILNALGRIPQKVLIKWDDDLELPVQFANIVPVSWIPQNDVLDDKEWKYMVGGADPVILPAEIIVNTVVLWSAHPKLRGFVTHGGLLSAQESVYHGVPTVCIPFYGDQHVNCHRSVQFGYGIMLNMADLTENIMYEAITAMTTNSQYRARAEELSKRFRSRQNSPLDTAMFWLEYVLEHNGADFIKCPRRKMHWLRSCMVDVAFVVTLVTAFVIFATKKVVSFVCTFVYKTRGTVKHKIN